MRPPRNIATLVIIVAIILALGTFVGLSFLQGRNNQPAEQQNEAAQTDQTLPTPLPQNGRLINIDGVEILVQIPDGQEVGLVNVALPPVVVQPAATEPPPIDPNAQPTPVPTVTPIVNVVTVPTAVPNPAVNIEPVIFQAYTVQASDTLYSISRQWVTSIALMAHHGLSQDDMIPGAVIQLPVGNPAYCPGQRPYAIGEGDTVFGIAAQYNTTAVDLRARNNLDENYTIRLAEIICVP